MEQQQTTIENRREWMTLVGQKAIHILHFLQDKNFAYWFRGGRLNSTVRNMQAWLTKLKDEGTTKKGIFEIKNKKNNVGTHNKGLYQALIWSIWWIYKCIWILKVDYWPGILPFREHSKNWWTWKLCSPFIEILQLLLQLLTIQLITK